MARDNAPVRHTCPKIDDAKHEIGNIIDYLKELNEELEVLRSENAALRDWGNKECKRADDFERDLVDASKEINGLKDEIHYLEGQVKQLEEELNEVNQ